MVELDRLQAPTPDPEDSRPQTPRSIDSRSLLGEQGRVLIIHDGRCYELRETRLGKLILTK